MDRIIEFYSASLFIFKMIHCRTKKWNVILLQIKVLILSFSWEEAVVLKTVCIVSVSPREWEDRQWIPKSPDARTWDSYFMWKRERSQGSRDRFFEWWCHLRPLGKIWWLWKRQSKMWMDRVEQGSSSEWEIQEVDPQTSQSPVITFQKGS